VNGCYKLLDHQETWSIAGLKCRTLHKDAHLLIINNAQEQSAIEEMFAAINR